jgi:hypothetical protein
LSFSPAALRSCSTRLCCQSSCIPRKVHVGATHWLCRLVVLPERALVVCGFVWLLLQCDESTRQSATRRSTQPSSEARTCLSPRCRDCKVSRLLHRSVCRRACALPPAAHASHGIPATAAQRNCRVRQSLSMCARIHEGTPLISGRPQTLRKRILGDAAIRGCVLTAMHYGRFRGGT